MFEWLKSKGIPGLERMSEELGTMLDEGRAMYVLAAEAASGGAVDPAVLRRVFEADERINVLQQRIRREIVVHMSVHGTGDVNACLIMMSLVKDAERIGDYAKNLADLLTHAPPLETDENHADLLALKDRTAAALTRTREVNHAQDVAAAREVARELAAIDDHCHARVISILEHQARIKGAASLVLVYRFTKRIVAHAMNVASSVFLPLDQIDSFDEMPRPDL